MAKDKTELVPELEDAELEFKKPLDFSAYKEGNVGGKLLLAFLSMGVFYTVYIGITGAGEVSARATDPVQEAPVVLVEVPESAEESTENEQVFNSLKERLVGLDSDEQNIELETTATEETSENVAKPRKRYEGTLKSFFLNTILPDYAVKQPSDEKQKRETKKDIKKPKVVKKPKPERVRSRKVVHPVHKEPRIISLSKRAQERRRLRALKKAPKAQEKEKNPTPGIVSF